MSFFKSQNKLSILTLVAFLFVVIYIFSNRTPELFPYGKEIMDFMLDLSVAVIAAMIFYIFQIYIPQIKIRSIANDELRVVLSRFIDVYYNIFISTMDKTHVDTWMSKIDNLDSFLSKSVAIEIANYFDLNGPANIHPQRERSLYLHELATDTKQRVSDIAQKYNMYLSEEILKYLHDIENAPLIEVMRVIHRNKKNSAYLPPNFLEDFFSLIKEINISLGFNIVISGSGFRSSPGLIQSSRLLK